MTVGELEQTRHAKHFGARRLADIYGLPVFPIKSNEKVPAIADWQRLATRDIGQIDRWWKEDPDYNVGVSTAGLCVVDLDVKAGANGRENWRQLSEEYELYDEVPKTLEVKTWSDGRHLYYLAPDGIEVRNSAGKLADGVDIRGNGGYVVGPGSFIDGKPYRIVSEGDGHRKLPAVAPAWLVEQAKQSRQRAENAGVRVTEETEAGVAAARRLVEAHEEVGEGGRNTAWHHLAAEFGDLGLEIATARDIGWDFIAGKISGGMGDEEFEKTLASAYGPGRQNAIGSRNPDAIPDMEPVEISKSRFPPTFITKLDATAIKPREWLVENMIVRGRVSLLVGPAGVAKSTWANQCAIALATGRSDICGFNVPGKQRAWIFNQEDDQEELDRRLIAALQHFGLSSADLYEGGVSMLARDSGVRRPLIVAGPGDNKLPRLDRSVLREVAEDIRQKQIGLFILDPLIEFHRLNENDNGEMGVVWRGIRDEIAEAANCGVLVSGHTRKPPAGDSESYLGSLDSLRGASSQGGVIRKAETMYPPAAKDGKRFSFPSDPKNYVRMDDAKNNIGRKRIEPLWFEKIGVRIANGEDVGVLKPVTIGASLTISEDRVAILATALRKKNLPSGEWIRLKDIVPGMPAEHRRLFEGHHMREELRKEFNGDEAMSDKGKVLQKNNPSKSDGYSYRLSQAPVADTPIPHVTE